MMRLDQQLLSNRIEKLEVAITIALLVYFIGISLPDPFPRNINALSYPLIAFLFVLHWKRLTWVATRDIPLLLLVGTALASFFWSTNPQLTLEACRGFLRMFIFGAYFTTRYSLTQQMKILAWVFGTAAVLSTLVVIFIPSQGLSEMHPGAWEGIFNHKSKLADAMSIGAILFCLNAIEDRTINWTAWIGFGATVAINFLTHSSSSAVSLLVLLSLMPLYKLIKQQYQLKIILLSFGCILAGFVAIFIMVNIEAILIDILGEGLDFNGRIPIWNLMIERISEERPWFGYGLNAFWNSDAGAFVGRFAWEDAVDATEFNAHSSYMELFAALGYTGIFIYLISLITVFTRTVILLISTKKVEFFWYIQFLIFIHIAAIPNVGKIASGASTYLVIYVSICLSTAVEYRKLRYKKATPVSTYKLQRY